MSSGYSLDNDLSDKVPGLTMRIWSEYKGAGKRFTGGPLGMMRVNGWTKLETCGDRFPKYLAVRADGRLLRISPVQGGGCSVMTLGMLVDGSFVLDPRMRPFTEAEAEEKAKRLAAGAISRCLGAER